MVFLFGLLKFVVVFIAIASSLLFLSSVISSIINPQIVLDEDGNAIDKNRNFRIWMGIILSVFWAIFSLL